MHASAISQYICLFIKTCHQTSPKFGVSNITVSHLWKLLNLFVKVRTAYTQTVLEVAQAHKPMPDYPTDQLIATSRSGLSAGDTGVTEVLQTSGFTG